MLCVVFAAAAFAPPASTLRFAPAPRMVAQPSMIAVSEPIGRAAKFLRGQGVSTEREWQRPEKKTKRVQR